MNKNSHLLPDGFAIASRFDDLAAFEETIGGWDLQRYRLNQVHRLLRRAHPGESTVSDAAND